MAQCKFKGCHACFRSAADRAEHERKCEHNPHNMPVPKECPIDSVVKCAQNGTCVGCEILNTHLSYVELYEKEMTASVKRKRDLLSKALVSLDCHNTQLSSLGYRCDNSLFIKIREELNG